MSQAAVDDGFMGGGGAPSFKFEKPGDVVQGRVVLVERVQQTDYATGTPKVWDDGKPRWQWNITLQTTLNDPNIPGDDGQRRIYAKGDLHKRIQSEVKKSGHRGSIVGGVLGVRFDRLGTPKPRQSPPKLFAVKFEPPSADSGFGQDTSNEGDSESNDDDDIPF